MNDGPDPVIPMESSARPVPSIDQRLRAALAIGAAGVAGASFGVLGPIALLLPIGAVIGVLASVRLPGVLLAAFLLIPYYKASLGAYLPFDLTVLMAVVASAQLVVIVSRRSRYDGSRLGLGLWLALAVAIIAGVMWTDDQELGRYLAILWVAVILLPSAAAVRVAQRPWFIDQFLATTFLVGGAIIVLGFPDVFASARLSVFDQNTIQTGQIAMLTALIALFWVSRVARGPIAIAGLVLVPVAVVVAVASGSRGPVLAAGTVVVVMLALWLVGGGRLSRHHARFLLVPAIVVAVLALVIDRLPGASLTRFALLQSALDAGAPTDTSAHIRADLIRVAVQLFAERPLLGNGTGSFTTWAQTHVGFTTFTYPHNDLTQWAAEFGIVGLVLFVAFVAIAFGRRLPQSPRWQTVYALAVFMFINGLVSGDIYGDRLMWGLLVLLVAAKDEAQHGPETIASAVPGGAIVRRPGVA